MQCGHFEVLFAQKNDANKVANSSQTSDSLGLHRSSVSSKSLQRKKDIGSNYENKKAIETTLARGKNLKWAR